MGHEDCIYTHLTFNYMYMNVCSLYSELEPEHLREERRCVLNSTQKLAFNNYQAFIGTADCSREVFKEVSGWSRLS